MDMVEEDEREWVWLSADLAATLGASTAVLRHPGYDGGLALEGGGRELMTESRSPSALSTVCCSVLVRRGGPLGAQVLAPFDHTTTLNSHPWMAYSEYSLSVPNTRLCTRKEGCWLHPAAQPSPATPLLQRTLELCTRPRKSGFFVTLTSTLPSRLSILTGKRVSRRQAGSRGSRPTMTGRTSFPVFLDISLTQKFSLLPMGLSSASPFTCVKRTSRPRSAEHEVGRDGPRVGFNVLPKEAE